MGVCVEEEGGGRSRAAEVGRLPGCSGVTAGDSYCLPMSVTAENQPAINMLKAEEERNEMLGGSRVVQGETGWYRKQQAKASKEAE